MLDIEVETILAYKCKNINKIILYKYKQIMFDQMKQMWHLDIKKCLPLIEVRFKKTAAT